MNETGNKTLKYVCIALGAAVVVLLLIVAFLLGQHVGTKNGGGSAPATAATDKYGAPVADPTEAAAPEADVPRNLDISMSAGSLTFVTGEAFGVKYDEKVIVVETGGDTLSIENKQRHPSASERRRMDVTVTVPEGCTFNNVDIEMGAGKLIAHALNASALEMELGAGSATLDRLTVTESAVIREGAGELIVKGGEIANLTLQCGAGATRVAASLTGTNKIDAAVGAVDLDLEGAAEDYTVAFQMGLGACYFNNEKLSRSGSYGEGPNRVDVSGGLGVMRVDVG